MLIKFAIEPAAMVHNDDASSRAALALHKRFIKLWEQFGLLVDPGKGPYSITSRFDDPALRPVHQIWRDAWKARRRCRRVSYRNGDVVGWNNVNSSRDMADQVGLIKVAFVEAVRGIAYLGIPEDEGNCSVNCGEVEAVLFPYADQSSAFAEMVDLSEARVIAAGTTVQQIWQDWFRPFASNAERVILLDRYLFAPTNTAGFVQMLHFLSADSPSCSVDVYASNPDTWHGQLLSTTQFTTAIESELNSLNSGLGSLNVHLVRNDVMTRDRYVSFDEWAFNSGHGFPEIFSQSELIDRQPCTMDATSSGFMKTILDEVKRIGTHFNVILTFSRTASGEWETTITTQ